MSQTFLDENPPMILDATCSYGKIWPRYATVRIDIRPEVHPDLVMDAKALQFPNHYFDEIYCDPPHMFRKTDISLEAIIAHRRRSGRLSANSFKRYGFWHSRAEWLDFLDKTNIEFARCLKPNGTLHYKILDGATKVYEVEVHMDKFEIVKRIITKTKSNYGHGKVHWLTMRPKP